MKQTKSTKVTNVFHELNSKEFGKVRVVSNEKTGEGYVSADDLCRILELSQKDVFPKLSDHLYTVVFENAGDKQQKMPFVDESGLYIMFLLSKKKDAIRFQDWLHDEFLHPLYEKRKAIIGLNKEDVLLIEPDWNRQVLRYLATASNVVKSGHFITGKEIPELTLSHMRGWWYNPEDKSTFLLQFNCLGNNYIYDNFRMNVYLMKDEDGCIEEGKMRISFLDLDDGGVEFMTIDTRFPDCIFTEWPILDFILEDQFMKEDFLKPENVNLAIILNNTMSFHRSRRV